MESEGDLVMGLQSLNRPSPVTSQDCSWRDYQVTNPATKPLAYIYPAYKMSWSKYDAEIEGEANQKLIQLETNIMRERVHFAIPID